MKNLKKIFALFAIIIILLGGFIILKNDFNYGIDYKDATELKFMLGEVLDIDEVHSIVSEVFNNKEFKIQKVDYFEDSVNITVVAPTDEEIQNLIDRFNSRYNQNNTMDSLNMLKTGHTSMLEIITPYIIPLVISLVVISLYMIIRYKELGRVKVVLESIGTSLLFVLIYFAAIAILRISVTVMTLPIAILILLSILTIYTYKYEKKIANV